MKPRLTIPLLCGAAAEFAQRQSSQGHAALYGVADGKAVGTHLERCFRESVAEKYEFNPGNAVSGIDFPDWGIDIKTTSIRQPQSSCPYQSAHQKIFGLGYSLIVFVYEKFDDDSSRTGRLDIHHVIFIDARRTADYQMTRGLRQIIENNGNIDDMIAFMLDKLLPVDDIQAERLAREIMEHPPEQGYLTISNALQWRLQYRRVIEWAGKVDGVMRIK